MKIPLVTILASSLLTSLSPAEETATGSISFATGDRLSGQALGVTEDGQLEWQSPDLHNERLPLDISQILDLSLAGNATLPPSDSHVATVTLTNGDTISGALKALDQEHVVLETPIAGEIKLRRSMASQLKITKAERVIFNGPLKLKDWTLSDGREESWQEENGEFFSQSSGGGVARSFEHGDRVCIGFNAQWRNSLRMSVMLLSDEGDTTQPDHCYEFSLNRRTVYLKKRPRGRIIVPAANIPQLAEQEMARFEFYVDRKEGTIALYVDGKKGQVWTDDRPEPDSFGNWLHFVSTNGYPVRISDLRVTNWDSDKLPDDVITDIDPEMEGLEGPRIHLQNGDVVIGEVGEVEDGRLKVITPVAPVRIPLERMRKMKLTGKQDPSYEEPRLMKGDVRAWFQDGSRLTFRLDNFKDDQLGGFSQTFGDATFALDTLSRLEFNIYSERFRALRDTKGW